MNRVFITLFPFAIILGGCTSNGVNGLIVTHADSPENITVDVMGDLIDGPQLTTSLITKEGGKYLYRARPFANSVQRINMSSGMSSSISFAKDGPNKVRRIQSFAVNSKNELILAADENIMIVDDTDSLKENFIIYPNNIDISLDGPFIVRATHEFPLQTYKDDLIVVLERDDSDKFSFPYHYEGPFLGRLSIRDKKITHLPIEWPEPTSYYGSLHQPFFTVVEDHVVFGFAYSPIIYLFNLTDDRVIEKGQLPFNGIKNSPFTGNFDQEEILMHRAKSVTYGRLKFDKVSRRYSQVVFVPAPPSSPMYGIAQQIGIRYFSEELKILGESVLPLGFFPESYHYNGDLFVRFQSEKFENRLSFRKITLEND
ncbi:DUF4221 domain-containing protein [Neolewinella aurantiaca]|uniref:DUF4221 domain-containing protein n=1 Tax=Neolewinella aurantiaca TaxID=2602767 RepID=A0A5C7F2H3_9BACT|nr:DUF4221 family protein [Neolewinella aurantiaca]TXF81443.1 DUF4221 domain-containing protein [Neolewinella aurantiaca]